MKHIICSGCSFTRAGRLNINVTSDNFLKEDEQRGDSNEFNYYPHWIQTLHPETNVINLGSVTNDNKTIARSIIYKIEKLKKQGFTLLIAEQNQILSAMADQVLHIASGHLTVHQQAQR